MTSPRGASIATGVGSGAGLRLDGAAAPFLRNDLKSHENSHATAGSIG
jgi:hypothetical protein